MHHDLATRIARILELATRQDQTPNAHGVTPEDLAGYLLDRLVGSDRTEAVRALDAAGVSL